MLLALLVAIPVSLLPARLRARFGPMPLVAGTAISGGFQLAGGAIFFFVACFSSVARSWPALSRFTFQTGNETASGALGYLFFFFSPAGLVTLYVILEGFVRVLSSVSLDEPLGSATPWLVLRLAGALRTSSVRAPGVVEDTLRPDGAALILETMQRLDWDERTTIEIGGAMLRVAQIEEHVGAERPHVIRLEPIPESWLVRRLVRYG